MTRNRWRRWRRRRFRSGFTLIEALIATALMAMILGALATVTAQWLPNWNHGFARTQRTELASRGLERLVADLAVAEFIPPNRETKSPLFDGTELSVTFVRSALGPNARPGLEIVRIAEAADARGLAVVRMRAPFAPLAPGTPLEQLRFADPVVLMRAPFRITFAYAGPDRLWRPTWRNQARLPTAIRVTIRDAATAQILAMSTATRLHIEVPAASVLANNAGNAGNAGDPASQKAQDDARKP